MRFQLQNVMQIVAAPRLILILALLSGSPRGNAEKKEIDVILTPTPPLTNTINGLTSIFLIKNSHIPLNKHSKYNGRVFNGKPEFGILTKTTKTFIQEGTTTAYTTEVLSTNLEEINGRVHAHFVKKNSRVLYNLPSVSSWIEGKYSSIPTAANLDIDESANNLILGLPSQHRYLLSINTDLISKHPKIPLKNENLRIQYNELTISPKNSIISESIADGNNEETFISKQINPYIGLTTFTVQSNSVVSSYMQNSYNEKRLDEADLRMQSIGLSREKPLISQDLPTTTTYFGFSDFVTTVGNAVIIFKPSSDSKPTKSQTVTSISGNASLIVIKSQPESTLETVNNMLDKRFIEKSIGKMSPYINMMVSEEIDKNLLFPSEDTFYGQMTKTIIPLAIGVSQNIEFKINTEALPTASYSDIWQNLSAYQNIFQNSINIDEAQKVDTLFNIDSNRLQGHYLDFLTDSHSYITVSEIKASEKVNFECIRTSQVFLTQVPSYVTQYQANPLIVGNRATEMSSAQTDPTIMTTFDIRQTTKHYCIQPTKTTKHQNNDKTSESDDFKNYISATQEPLKDLFISSTQNSYHKTVEVENVLHSSMGSDDYADSLEIFYKTLYTTYTYLTTFFDYNESTISTKSHIEVISSIITKNKNEDITLSHSNNMSNTAYITLSNDIIDIVRGSSQDANKKDIIELKTKLFDNLKSNTYFTSYTYFTTLFGKNTYEIESHTEIVTNKVGYSITKPSTLTPSTLTTFKEPLFKPDSNFNIYDQSFIKESKYNLGVPDLKEDQESSETNINEISPSDVAEFGQQIFFTTYTYFTTLYDQDSGRSTVKSRLETMSNVIPLQKGEYPGNQFSPNQDKRKVLFNDKVIHANTGTNPLRNDTVKNTEKIPTIYDFEPTTFYTTFTYYTTSYNSDHSKIYSRLETESRVVESADRVISSKTQLNVDEIMELKQNFEISLNTTTKTHINSDENVMYNLQGSEFSILPSNTHMPELTLQTHSTTAEIDFSPEKIGFSPLKRLFIARNRTIFDNLKKNTDSHISLINDSSSLAYTVREFNQTIITTPVTKLRSRSNTSKRINAIYSLKPNRSYQRGQAVRTEKIVPTLSTRFTTSSNRKKNSSSSSVFLAIRPSSRSKFNTASISLRQQNVQTFKSNERLFNTSETQRATGYQKKRKNHYIEEKQLSLITTESSRKYKIPLLSFSSPLNRAARRNTLISPISNSTAKEKFSLNRRLRRETGTNEFNRNRSNLYRSRYSSAVDKTNNRTIVSPTVGNTRLLDVNSRISSKYRGATLKSDALDPENTRRTIRPTRPGFVQRQQFTIRDREKLDSYNLRMDVHSQRLSTKKLRRPTTHSPPSRHNLRDIATTTQRNRKKATLNERTRSSPVRERDRNGRNNHNYNNNNIFEELITITHYLPSETTIPFLNGQSTEYKTIVTAQPSLETLSHNDYTNFIGSNGKTSLALNREETSVDFIGRTEVKKFILHATPTTSITFTPTTIRGRKTSFSHILPTNIYSVETITSTQSPISIASSDSPLANLLLTQLLLGNLVGLPGSNPLFQNNLMPKYQTLAPTEPITEYKIRTSSYVTTLFQGMSTVLPVTFQGKKIFTTVYDTTAQTITATEFITDTLIITPTPTQQRLETITGNVLRDPNAYLLQQLLLQQQFPQLLKEEIIEQTLDSRTPQKLESNSVTESVYNVGSENNFQSTKTIKAPKTQKDRRKKSRKSNRNKTIDVNNYEEISPSLTKSSVITLYISGRKPGEFSTVLSTVDVTIEPTRLKRNIKTSLCSIYCTII